MVPVLKVCWHCPSTIFDCRWKSYTVLPYLRVSDQYVLRASRLLTFSYSAGIKGSRRTQSGNVAMKYCSDRCRHNKPGPVDRKTENAFLALLEDEKVGPVNSDPDAVKSQRRPGRTWRSVIAESWYNLAVWRSSSLSRATILGKSA